MSTENGEYRLVALDMTSFGVEGEKKTAEEWLKEPIYAGDTILDPDGWRHEGMSWDDEITEVEFQKRFSECTIMHRKLTLEECQKLPYQMWDCLKVVSFSHGIRRGREGYDKVTDDMYPMTAILRAGHYFGEDIMDLFRQHIEEARQWGAEHGWDDPTPRPTGLDPEYNKKFLTARP